MRNLWIMFVSFCEAVWICARYGVDEAERRTSSELRQIKAELRLARRRREALERKE